MVNPDEDFREGEEEAAEGVALFGITLSPQILAVVIAAAGLGASVYLALNFVKPLWEQRTTLRREIAEKEAQRSAQGDIVAQIEAAQIERDAAEEIQRDVLSMFASPESLDTLLFDLNQQVRQRNANLGPEEVRAKLVAEGCPTSVIENYADLERQVDGFFATAKLTRFEPVFPETSRQTNAAAITEDGYELVQDGSLGASADNQVKRQTYEVEMQGNFDQTRMILTQMEQLQPLLVVKNFQAELEDQTFLFDRNGILSGCQPETKINSSFTLQALLPLTQEELQQILQAQEETEGEGQGEEAAQ
ncbi:hypothetical protein AY599_09850 [Leptolyngbya valderiana BDU 20041]|nr:hypothetical protein AY599_09850 [Leptolyngbya valderiana BDU 20041]PPT08351.1 Type IV pilus biogenesis protein PilO [Geitlerinema sp. FC II]